MLAWVRSVSMENEGLPAIIDVQPLDQEVFDLLMDQWLDPGVEDEVIEDQVLEEEEDNAHLEVPPADMRSEVVEQGDVPGTHSPCSLQRRILLQIGSDVPYRQIYDTLHMVEGLPMPIIRMIEYMHWVICRDYVIEMFVYVGFLPNNHYAHICRSCANLLHAFDEDTYIWNMYIRMQSIIPYTTDIRFMVRCDRCAGTLVTNVLACHCQERNPHQDH